MIATGSAAAAGPPTALPARWRVLADWGDNCTLELAMRVLRWHGIGAITPAGPRCKHCMPATPWPCAAFETARRTEASLLRDEPYGPPPGNAYLQAAIDADARTACA